MSKRDKYIIEESHKYEGCYNIYDVSNDPQGESGPMVKYFAENDDRNYKRAVEWVKNANKQTLGQRLSPILGEIEDTLLEHEADQRGKPGFTDEGFRAGIKIFASVLLDKAWEHGQLQKADGETIGQAIRLLVKQYTGIDTHKIYEN